MIAKILSQNGFYQKPLLYSQEIHPKIGLHDRTYPVYSKFQSVLRFWPNKGNVGGKYFGRENDNHDLFGCEAT